MDEDADLPLHDEAKARARWRSDEAALERGDREAAGRRQRSPAPDSLLKDLAERPPD